MARRVEDIILMERIEATKVGCSTSVAKEIMSSSV